MATMEDAVLSLIFFLLSTFRPEKARHKEGRMRAFARVFFITLAFSVYAQPDQSAVNDIIDVSDTGKFQAISKDSYSDTAIYETIKKKRGMEPLLFAALQTAIVGYGNKVYGEYKIGDQLYDVVKVYREYDVKADLQQSAKLEPGDLTPRRLQRFFRYQIHDYLEDNNSVYPYLWKKYSSADLKFRTITFPGAESMVETEDEGEYLLATYHELDKRLGTNISERIRRVLIARGIIKQL